MIMEEMHNYYSNLYTKGDIPHSDTIFTKSFFDSINIPDEDKHVLDQLLSKNEIFRTISYTSLKVSWS